jgi:hypothetical protein
MPKPQLHVSGLMMLSKCGEQFRRRYIQGDIVPPGVAMVVGTATHASVRGNLSAKIEHGKLLPLEHAKAIARDQLNTEWEKGVLLDDEQKSSPHKAKSDAIDKAVRLSGAHAERLAPLLLPTHVERSWSLELRGFPIDLVGSIDIQEAKMRVRDTKTSAKSPSADAADTSEQLTVYAMAVKTLDGTGSISVYLDYLVDLRRVTKIVSLLSERRPEDYDPLLRRIENASICMEKGVFVPARPEDWWCSPKWCGYFSTCPYVRRRR